MDEIRPQMRYLVISLLRTSLQLTMKSQVGLELTVHMLVSRHHQSSCLSAGMTCVLRHDQLKEDMVCLGFLIGQQEELRTWCGGQERG